jgi:hypothetical protein
VLLGKLGQAGEAEGKRHGVHEWIESDGSELVPTTHVKSTLIRGHRSLFKELPIKLSQLSLSLVIFWHIMLIHSEYFRIVMILRTIATVKSFAITLGFQKGSEAFE